MKTLANDRVRGLSPHSQTALRLAATSPQLHLPPVPPATEQTEQWQLLSLQPITGASGGLELHIAFAVPPAGHRQYRLVVDASARDLASQRQEAYEEFSSTPEVERLRNIQRGKAEADGLLTQTRQRLRDAEDSLRSAIGNGENPEPQEAKLRAAKADEEIYAIRHAATVEALSVAEKEAVTALRRHMAAVREEAIADARRQLAAAVERLVEVVAEPALDVAVAVGTLQAATAPIADSLSRLPS